MKDPCQEDLLGYVLGALDADQHQRLQHQIDQDPEYDDQLLKLKAQLVPLELVLDADGCRPGLARRTCETVANLCGNWRTEAAAATRGFHLPEVLPIRSSWSLAEMLVAAAAIGILASLLIPMLANARQQSQIVACSNNLRSIGLSLAAYSENHQGRFVEIPPEGPLSFAGIVGPVLKDNGLIEDDNWFACQGTDREQPVELPSIQQIRRCAASDQLEHFRRVSSGDYGYSLGHIENGQYVSPRNLNRPFQIILADRPSVSRIDGPSDNHRGRGQNCLFEDFHIQFVSGNSVGDDLVYVNAYNIVGPGIGSRDSVIGASHLSPLLAPQVFFRQPLD